MPDGSPETGEGLSGADMTTPAEQAPKKPDAEQKPEEMSREEMERENAEQRSRMRGENTYRDVKALETLPYGEPRNPNQYSIEMGNVTFGEEQYPIPTVDEEKKAGRQISQPSAQLWTFGRSTDRIKSMSDYLDSYESGIKKLRGDTAEAEGKEDGRPFTTDGKTLSEYKRNQLLLAHETLVGLSQAAEKAGDQVTAERAKKMST